MEMAFVKILMKGYKIKPELGNHRQYRKSVVTFSCQHTSINPHNRQGSTDCTVCTTIQIGLNSPAPSMADPTYGFAQEIT